LALERVILKASQGRDSLVWIAKGENRQAVRLVEVVYGNKWYRCLSNCSQCQTTGYRQAQTQGRTSLAFGDVRYLDSKIHLNL
jgi:hypothetical protein